MAGSNAPGATAATLLLALVALAAMLGLSTSHRNRGAEAFFEDVLTKAGDKLIDTACTVKTREEGVDYKMHEFSGLHTHPDKKGSCFFRKTAGGGTIEAVKECEQGSPLWDPSVMTGIGTENVAGAVRCVIDMKPSQAVKEYEAYDAKLISTAVTRTPLFGSLHKQVNTTRGDIQTTAIRRDVMSADLDAQVQRRQKGHTELMVAYASLGEALQQDSLASTLALAAVDNVTKVKEERAQAQKTADEQRAKALAEADLLATTRSQRDTQQNTANAKTADANTRGQQVQRLSGDLYNSRNNMDPSAANNRSRVSQAQSAASQACSSRDQRVAQRAAQAAAQRAAQEAAHRAAQEANQRAANEAAQRAANAANQRAAQEAAQRAAQYNAASYSTAHTPYTSCYGVPGYSYCPSCQSVVDAYRSRNWGFNTNSFSQCTYTPPPPPPPSPWQPSLPVSNNGMCGPDQGTRCPGGHCCSVFGWCGGPGSQHCGMYKRGEGMYHG